MTNEEAIKILESQKLQFLEDSDISKAYDIAINDLKEKLSEKPIEKLPKKPIVNESGRIIAFKCPRCGNTIAYKVGERLRFSTLFENNICSCGQEIDWSEE